MSGPNPRRLGSFKSFQAPPRKRVSFAASEDVREFVRESAVGEEVVATPAWLVPAAIPAKQEGDNSTVASTSSDPGDDGLARTRRASTDVSSRFFVPTRDNLAEHWATEHGQDFHGEWSEISLAAQRKVHETANRKSSRRRQSLIAPGTSSVLVPVELDKKVNVVDGEKKKQEPKKKKKKKKKMKKMKKKKRKEKKGKGKKKKRREMSVMAFLRGSSRRNSKAKVERALKKMMKRIAKRVKKKMVTDKDVDMAKVKKLVKRSRRKKQLYTIKKIRGRSIGLNSLLKRWKWAFIFS